MQGRPAAGFQAPPNFANFNVNAPVIRLGNIGKDGPSHGDGGHGRRGVGMHHQPRENQVVIAPTREEVARTLFIGKLPPTMQDIDMERILRATGRLRKWMRAMDGDGKACSFGFAEFEDAESLQAAIDTLPDIEVPATPVEPMTEKTGETEENGESAAVERVKLLVSIFTLQCLC
jgi:hypothetical protein